MNPSRTAFPSPPAATATAVATVAGARTLSPASDAQHSAILNRLVKCAACAARGPGTAQLSTNPAAYSSAPARYSAFVRRWRSSSGFT